MKKCIPILLMAFLSIQINAQNSDKELVKKACLNYLEGFYEGNTAKLKASLNPTLHKFGFWKSSQTNSYGEADYMTFEAALKYAENVKDKKNFPPKDAAKKVDVFEVSEKIASAKVTAWWGIDYILLSKHKSGWMIEQVLWQGPLPKPVK